MVIVEADYFTNAVLLSLLRQWAMADVHADFIFDSGSFWSLCQPAMIAN